MNAEDLATELSHRSPGQWELYLKRAESRELDASPALRRELWRLEEGWAARWWASGAPRFAAASNPDELCLALEEAQRPAVGPEAPPEWPTQRAAASAEPATVEAPPDLYGELSRAVAAASHGEAALAGLTLRRGRAVERIVNGSGLDVAQALDAFDGVARAVARRGGRAREVRLSFRWEAAPETDALARRLADAATLPLSDRPAPFSSGQWLLDPAVGAALLAALAPMFASARPPRWIARGAGLSPALSVADDASADAPFDGEGVATRRVLLVENGALVGRLFDLRSAAAAAARSTGHGVRASYRMPPRSGPRRIFFEVRDAKTPPELLASVTRGLFASALTAPVRVDLEDDRYEIEFTGVSVLAGRAGGPVAGARASGRISELLNRVRGAATDTRFFASPFLAGSPTLLVERARFE